MPGVQESRPGLVVEHWVIDVCWMVPLTRSLQIICVSFLASGPENISETSRSVESLSPHMRALTSVACEVKKFLSRRGQI